MRRVRGGAAQEAAMEEILDYCIFKTLITSNYLIALM